MSPAAGHAWHPKLTLSALALVLAGVAAPASAANFQYRVPIGGLTAGAAELSVALTSGPSLPAGEISRPYSYDLKQRLSVTGDNAYSSTEVSWELLSGMLPLGLSLGVDGVISGIPTTKDPAGSSFQVGATYKGKNGQQVYTIVVNGVALHVTQLSAGHLHTCALTDTGGVKCWGANYAGQLGTGTGDSSLTPVSVVGLSSGVVSVSAGLSHTCAVTAAGGVLCWGDGMFGKLGNPDALSGSTTPVQVSGLGSGVASVSAGRYHTCAVTTGGGVKCWGADSQGQLGNDISLVNQSTPVDVAGLTSGVTSVSAASHTCAVTAAGGAKCWGPGSGGVLGNGLTADQPTPVDVMSLTSGVAQVSAGPSHTCAVTTAGGVLCWGSDLFGELGNDALLVESFTPVSVFGASSGFSRVSVGDSFSCAVTQAGALKCWGRADLGKLGNGMSSGAQPVPSDVTGLNSGVTLVTTGTWHACAIAAGRAQCWGRSDFGQLGNAAVSGDQLTPIDVQP